MTEQVSLRTKLRGLTRQQKQLFKTICRSYETIISREQLLLLQTYILKFLNQKHQTFGIYIDMDTMKIFDLWSLRMAFGIQKKEYLPIRIPETHISSIMMEKDIF